MSLRLSVIVPCLLVSSLLAAELAEKWTKRLDSADGNYREAVQKADNIRFYAVQKASAERIRLLKSAMMDATKAGDLDAANEIKAKLTAAESSGGIRPKPKNLVKFGGHEYAIVDQKVTWHVAKRMCEEMGGHLAIINSSQEDAFTLDLCRGDATWIGATDEEEEGAWVWVDGTRIDEQLKSTMRLKDITAEQHHLSYWPDAKGWENGRAGYRARFLCEWE